MSSLGLSLLILVVVGIGAIVVSNALMNRRGRTLRLRDDDPPARSEGSRAEPRLAEFTQTKSAESRASGSDYFDERLIDDGPDHAHPATPEDRQSRSQNVTQPERQPETPASVPQNAEPTDATPGSPVDERAQGGAPRRHDPSEWRDAVRQAQERGGMPTAEAAGEQDEPRFGLAPGSPSGYGMQSPEPDQSAPKVPLPDAPRTNDTGSDPARATRVSSLEAAVSRADAAAAGLRPNAVPVREEDDPDAPIDPAQGSAGSADLGSETAGALPQPREPVSARRDVQPTAQSTTDATTDPDERDLWATTDPQRSAAKFLAVVELDLVAATAGARLLEVLTDFDHVGTKPVRVIGRASTTPGVDIPISAASAYTALRFELLQVNRNGPVNAVEYSEFVSRLDVIADKLDVQVDPPDMNVVLVRSRVLDAEVSALDAQVAVNVSADKLITVEKVGEIAARVGLVARDNDSHVRLDAAHRTCFSVRLDDDSRRVVLLLDVPRVPRAEQPIRAMVECAWTFAQDLEARMVDDSGRLIDNALFERIEAQLDLHYQALLAAGLPAGSSLARQVFN